MTGDYDCYWYWQASPSHGAYRSYCACRDLSSVALYPPTSGGGYKAIVKCDEFCYTHLTIFNVLHSTVKLLRTRNLVLT